MWSSAYSAGERASMIESNCVNSDVEICTEGFMLKILNSMNAPEKIRLTEFSHGGGCGCKIAPAVLTEILASTPIRGSPKELLVGTETDAEAAAHRLNDRHAPA